VIPHGAHYTYAWVLGSLRIALKNRQRNRLAELLDVSSRKCRQIGKEKGPLASKRPKSREETPKEGGGTRRKSRTALQ
jgi:hypothetical protein